MIFYAKKALARTKDIEDAETFFSSDDSIYEVTLISLQNIGEGATYAPKSTRKNYPQIRWQHLINVSNYLAHQCSELDMDDIWEAIHIDIPKLPPLLQEIQIKLAQELQIEVNLDEDLPRTKKKS